MAEFPSKAKVVIIGLGGIVGASIAHHLIERGWDDIIGIDKSGIPTDIGSTAHASDFCYTTSHDYLSVWTTQYSIDFYEKMGHYARIGGLEVARTGDDTWMEEIKRKLTSAKAFGTRARLIGPAEIKKKFPLIEEKMVQGGMWDPDAGLVIPRSQTVAGKLVEQAQASGKLKVFANTPARSLVIENGRIKGVVTDRGTIMADYVVVCAGLWGRLIAEMAGEDLPVMPVDHPLTFFGPYTEFAGTGKEIGRVAHAGKADLDRALEAAQKGFETWRDMTPAERSKIMTQGRGPDARAGRGHRPPAHPGAGQAAGGSQGRGPGRRRHHRRDRDTASLPHRRCERHARPDPNRPPRARR